MVTHSPQKHSSSHRKRGSHLNGEYRQLKATQFTANMIAQQIQKLMGLRSVPMYQTDGKGYIEFEAGLFILFYQYSTHIRTYFMIGTFSKVFEAVDISDQTKCAIKVIRNTHRYIDHFQWQNHPCFVFKLYGPSMKEQSNKDEDLAVMFSGCGDVCFMPLSMCKRGKAMKCMVIQTFEGFGDYCIIPYSGCSAA